PALFEALAEGIASTGAVVWNFGLGPTPMMYFSVHHSGADAGIMVTGSHNPKHHNGFKLMLGKASFYGESITALGAMAAAGDYESGAGSVEQKDCRGAYLSALVEGFRPEGAKPLRAVFDPGNGAAGEITQKLAAALPGGSVVINAEVDGNFPNHHPDPTVPANMRQLIDTVAKEGCDLGIAFDGDGDRVGAVDRKGGILYGDQLMVLFARD